MGEQRKIYRGDKRIADRNIFTNRVLEILCFGGGLTKEAVRIMHGNPNAKKTALSSMRKRNWVKTINGTTILWYASKHVNEWSARLPEEYGEMGIKENHGRKKDSASLYRIGEFGKLLAIMQEADIPIVPTKTEEELNQIKYGVVPTKFIKRFDGYDQKVLRVSKSQGLIKRNQENYLVYTSDKSGIEIESTREYKFMHIIKIITNHYELNVIAYVGDLDNLQSFVNPINKRNTKNIPLVFNEKKEKELLILPGTYEGAVLTKIMMQEGIKEKLQEITVGALKKDSNMPIDKIENNTWHVNFLYPDAGHLQRAMKYLKHNQTKKIVVHCFEQYKEGIRNLFPTAEIKAYAITDIILKL